MGITGLLALLLMLFGHTKPVDSLPLHAVCDIRVLKKFAKEAEDLESRMRNAQEAEIRRGLELFTTAILKIRDIIPDSSLRDPIDESYSRIRSLILFLNRLNAQQGETTTILDSAQATTHVRTMKEFFLYYYNFLRGKVIRFVSKVCQDQER
ncbi:erythropoietin isoform X3 [Rhinatrema bivittatum]|uniref:erythropoietin isoform X3 n=1 Tax=Rhinatrema bivittatum TaxID=194408 RepID=UPI0011277AA7|nr:erythropoietin isoform X3 [Rhinatrema bivittatum]